MEPYHSLNPFYLAFAVLRLLVYLTSFIKVKPGIRYGVIYLLALWTLGIDALYVFTFFSRKTCCDEPIEVPEGLLIDQDVIVLKWIAAMTFWHLLDQNITAFQVIKRVCTYSKHLLFGLSLLAITNFRSDRQPPMDLFEDNTFAVSMSIVTTIAFLIMAWKSPTGKHPSFLMFGCIFTQLPLSSTLKTLTTYLDDYPLLLTPISQKIQYIILFGATQAETFTVSCVIGDTYHRKFQWPGFKGAGGSHDIENFRENSDTKDVGQLVKVDC